MNDSPDPDDWNAAPRKNAPELPDAVESAQTDRMVNAAGAAERRWDADSAAAARRAGPAVDPIGRPATEWEGSARARAGMRMVLLVALVGWTAHLINTIYLQNYRVNSPEWTVMIGAGLASGMVGTLLFLRAGRLRLMAIGVAGAASAAGVLAAGIMLGYYLQHPRWANPLTWTLWIGSAIASALGVGASIVLTRSLVRAVWRQAVAGAPVAADGWDAAGQVAQQRRVPLVEKHQIWVRIFAILPLLIPGILGLVVMAISVFVNRLSSGELLALLAIGITLVFYMHGLYSPAWVTRFLSIGASAGMALAWMVLILSGAAAVLEAGPRAYGVLFFVAIGLVICGLGLWGSYHYVGGELVRLADKAREKALRIEEENLESGSWDEAKPDR